MNKCKNIFILYHSKVATTTKVAKGNTIFGYLGGPLCGHAEGRACGLRHRPAQIVSGSWPVIYPPSSGPYHGGQYRELARGFVCRPGASDRPQFPSRGEIHHGRSRGRRPPLLTSSPAPGSTNSYPLRPGSTAQPGRAEQR